MRSEAADLSRRHRAPRSRSSRARCFSGSLDGGMRAYSTKDGAILWTFDTNKEFQTVNGVKANGGGLEGPGAIVSGGMLYFNSGYGGFVGNGGNVLLAFGHRMMTPDDVRRAASSLRSRRARRRSCSRRRMGRSSTATITSRRATSRPS